MYHIFELLVLKIFFITVEIGSNHFADLHQGLRFEQKNRVVSPEITSTQ